MGTTWSALGRSAKKLPGVEEGSSYGTAALKVRGKLIARLKEDGDTVALGVELDARDALIELDPKSFFVTDHYRAHPWVLVRLGQVPVALLDELLELAWRRKAPKRLIDASPSRTKRK